ncbi:hypothetical protein L1887_51345 [Cichorium endivia]|nr:hypothetical protein L1887_51345 [Cichorium endivia]
MVVGLDLGKEGHGFLDALVDAQAVGGGGGGGGEAGGLVALDDGGVVRVGADGVLWMELVVLRIMPKRVLGMSLPSMAELLVGVDEALLCDGAVLGAVCAEEVDVGEGSGLRLVEEGVCGGGHGRDELGHAVVEEVVEAGQLVGLEVRGGGGLDDVGDAALDACDVVLEGAHAGDVGSLAGPGRDAARTGEHKEHGRVGLGSEGGLHGGARVGQVDVVAVDEEAVERVALRAGGICEHGLSRLVCRVDKVDIDGIDGCELVTAELGVGPLQQLGALGGVEHGRADEREHPAGSVYSCYRVLADVK